jgi:hypothetical protein
MEVIAEVQHEADVSIAIPQPPEDTAFPDKACRKYHDRELFGAGNETRCRWPCYSETSNRSTRKGFHRCKRGAKEYGLCPQHYSLAQEVASETPE